MKGEKIITANVLLVSFLVSLVGLCAVPANAATPAGGDDPAAALEELYKAARKEGKLVVHDGGTPEDFPKIVSVFKKRFPGIEVETIIVASPTIAPRIIVEAQAGKLSIDVASGSPGGYLNDLIDRGLVRKLDISDVVNVDPEYISLDGRHYATDSLVPVIAYNTKLVSPSDVPKTWEDLLNPKWKGGKIFMSRFGIVCASLYYTRPESEVVNYLKQLRMQKLTFLPNPTGVLDALASGQAQLAEIFSNMMNLEQYERAPVAFTPIGPQMYLIKGTYALEGSPHPNAAKLWTAWRMTPEARQATWKLARQISENKPENCPSAKMLFDKAIKFIPINTREKADLRGKYQMMVQELLGMVAK